MGDISRDTFDPSKNYNMVVAQQNHALLDAEFNELQDIIKWRNKNIANSIFGTGAIGEGFGVKATGVNNTVAIKAGIFINKGDYVHLIEDYTLSGLTTPAIGGTRIDIVYADYYDEEIDSSADTDLKDPVLNVETCIRNKTTIEIKIKEGTVVDTVPSLPAVLTGHSVFIIAYLYRADADASVTSAMITDQRSSQAACFVESGLEVTAGAGFAYDWTAGVAWVGGVRYEVSSGSGTVPSNTTSYVYVDNAGAVQDASALPPDFHVPLAAITTDASSIISVENMRNFAPAIVNSPLGSTVPNPSNSIQEERPVGAGTSQYDVVYINGANSFDQSDASAVATMPVQAMMATARDSFGNSDLLYKGIITNSGWAATWSDNDTLYASTTAGEITNDISAFTTGNVVQKVGSVLDAANGTIIFNPSPELIKI